MHNWNAQDDGKQVSLTISKLAFDEKLIEDVSFNICIWDGEAKIVKLTCEDLHNLYRFLNQYDFIKDLSKSYTGSFVSIKTDKAEVLKILNQMPNVDLNLVLKNLVSEKLTSDDLNIISGRKDALCQYQDMLRKPTLMESKWQEFFEKNEWIFGYGLSYKYLSILQREAHVSNVNLNGKGEVIGDFLMADNRFTKLVELKRPDTPLFANETNRGAWKLSAELNDAVGQILAQKANWQIKSQQKDNFSNKGDFIDQYTFDPECILVIGNLNNLSGSDEEKMLKIRTFELFRRNLRNIEILCYDELLERAKFITSK